VQCDGEIVMKNISKKSTSDYENTKPKIGFLSTEKIRRMFRLNTTTLVINSKPSSSRSTAREEEQLSYEIEAELRKATARAYANTIPLR
jgi:dTDP-4-dehydrorhamnose reductase